MGRPANQVLDDLEDLWSPRLRAVSLAAELQLESTQVRLAAQCLGVVQKKRPEWLSRYPASMVVALSGIGALEYESGNFWSAVWDTAGVHGDQYLQSAWGGLFLRGLGRFSCPAFDHLPLRYVSPILMHAGVPRYCLGDLIDLVIRRAEVDGGLDGPGFVGWVTDRRRESRLQGLDKPVQYFLQEGGEFAVDWVDRLVDLIDRLREPAPALDGVRLPTWVLEAVQGYVAEVPLRERRTPTGPQAPAQREGVRLALDPYGLGVHLVLPPIGDAAGASPVWRVVVDGVTHGVKARGAWPGASQTMPGTAWSLPRPVRAASVFLGAGLLSQDIDVVDPEDPLLVFADDGKRFPSSLPLPPEPVWLLYPTTDAPSGITYDGTPAHRQPADVPYGWEGWSLERVDLQGVRRCRYGDAPWRAVRGASRARLEITPPVAGVTTAYRSPVHRDPPVVVLPATADATAGWSVLVRRPGQQPLVSLELEVSAATRVDVFAEVPRPLVGPYQVVVRGPLGRGLNRELEIVEGLMTASDPPWREFALHGLVPAATRLAAASGVTLRPATADLAHDEEGRHVEVAGSGCTEVLQFTPGHMAAQLNGAGFSGRWSAGPLRIESESVAELDDIVVRVPDAVASADLVLRKGDTELQRTTLTARAGMLRVDLRRFHDTLAVAGAGRLDLELLRRPVPLAFVRPRRLASSLEPGADGTVVCHDLVDVEGLKAGVYALHRPWRPPVVLPLSGPDLTLPADVEGLGPLLVSLRVDDPWLPEPWPAWPTRENTFRVDAPISSDAAGWEGALGCWLRGADPLIADAESFWALLVVYGLRDALSAEGVEVPVRDDVAVALSADPAGALTAAADARAGRATSTAALIHARAAAARLAAPVPLPLSAWATAPLAAVLAASLELREGDAGAREELRRLGGPVVETILSGEPDPYAGAARFGPDAAQLAGLPKAVLDQVWRAANIVPASLLDEDARVTAARQLFEARDRPALRRVAGSAMSVASTIEARLKARGDTRLADSLRARTSNSGWQSLPTLSLGLAIAARLAARGDGEMSDLVEQHAQSWAAMARHAPDLVEADVVLAECLCLGAST